MATPRILVSHSHADNDFCLRLVSDLRAAIGDPDAVWMDVSGGLAGGDSWWAEIRSQLRQRVIFLVILSPDAAASAWVNNEVDIAWAMRAEGRKRVIPLLWRPCDVRDDLRTVHMIRFAPPRAYDQALGDLLRALGVARSATPATAAPTVAARSELRRDHCARQRRAACLGRGHLQGTAWLDDNYAYRIWRQGS